MSLQDEIKAFNDKMLPNIPPEVLAVMVKATENLAASTIAQHALSEGDSLPSFSLHNVHGQVVNSIDLLSRGSLVVSFYRGSW